MQWAKFRAHIYKRSFEQIHERSLDFFFKSDVIQFWYNFCFNNIILTIIEVKGIEWVYVGVVNMKINTKWNWSKVVQYPMTFERCEVKMNGMNGKALISQGTMVKI